MAKRIENKRKTQNTGLKNDKTKLDAQERQIGKATRLREEQVLQARKNQELKILELQV